MRDIESNLRKFENYDEDHNYCKKINPELCNYTLHENKTQCVRNCTDIELCLKNVGGSKGVSCIKKERRFYNDEYGDCKVCHSSCKFHGCINGESGENGGCIGCWVDVKPKEESKDEYDQYDLEQQAWLNFGLCFKSQLLINVVSR